jgi:hypothetical protein
MDTKDITVFLPEDIDGILRDLEKKKKCLSIARKSSWTVFSA